MAATEAAVGVLPPRLMDALRRHMAEALTARGMDPRHPGAGGLIIFHVVRGLLTELGCLPDDVKQPDAIASTLMWQTQAVLHWLRDLDTGRELSAADWTELAKYPHRLRETAAHLEQWLTLYEEGK